MLVELALQVQRVVVLGNRDSLVKIAVPLTLKMEGGLQLVHEVVGVHLVVEEGHVHIYLVGLMVDGVAVLEQDVAIVALIALGTHKIQLTHGKTGHVGVGHLHAIVLLADGGDKAGCLELKVIDSGIVLVFNVILAVIILEKLFKVGCY